MLDWPPKSTTTRPSGSSLSVAEAPFLGVSALPIEGPNASAGGPPKDDTLELVDQPLARPIELDEFFTTVKFEELVVAGHAPPRQTLVKRINFCWLETQELRGARP